MNTRARRFLILGIALVVLAAAALGLWALRNAQIQRRLADSREQGLRLHAEAQYESALPRLSYFAARDRSDPDVLYALADSRRRVPMENARHILSAISFARSAAEAAPGEAKPLRLLLELYAQAGFTTELLDTTDRLLRIEPDYFEALQIRVGALHRLGRSREALTAAAALTDRFPDDIRGHEAVVLLMNSLGESREDLRAYVDRAAASHPDRAEFVLLQSRVALSQQRFDEARELAQRAVNLRIESPEALPTVTRYLDLLGLSPEADAVLVREAEKPDRARVARRLTAERLWKSGRVQEARQTLRPLLSPIDAASDDELGLAAILDAVPVGDPTGANAAAALRLRVSNQASAWNAWLDAREAVASGRRADAKARLAQIPVGAIGAELVRMLEGQAHLAAAEYPAAIEAFRDAIRIEPRWLEVRMAAIDAAAASGDPALAFSLAQDAASFFPDRLAAILTLARSGANLVDAGSASADQSASLIALLDQLAEEQVDQAEIMILRARILAGSGDREGARRAIERLLDSGEPLSPPLLADLLRLAQRMGDEGLTERIDRAGGASASNADLVFIRAINAASQGRVVEGQAMLRRAIDEAPQPRKLEFRRALATYLARTADPEATAYLADLAQRHPDSLQLQLDLLNSDGVWTSRETVRAALDRLKAIAGESSTWWRLFESRRRLTFERTPASAAEVARSLGELLREDPQSVSALAMMGEANIILNDNASAIEYFSRAVDAQPDSPGLYPTLISLLQSAGETDSARRRLEAFSRFEELPLSLRRQRMQQTAFQAMWEVTERDLRYLAEHGEERDRLAYAEFLTMRGRPDEAGPLYETILATPEPGVPAVIQAAQFFALIGDEPRAERLISDLAGRLPGVEGALLRAGFEERRGSPSQAEQILRRAVESTGNPAAWAELTRFYVRQNQETRAREAIAAALTAHPADESLISLDRVFRQISEGAASPSGAAASSIDPAALALLEANRARPAPGDNPNNYIERLRTVTSRHPTFYPGWQTLVSALFDAGKPEEAVNAARIAMRTIPADPRAAQLATEALSVAGRSAEAITVAQAWRELSHADPFPADFSLAGLFLDAGRVDESLSLLRRHHAVIVRRADVEPLALSLYARALTGSGRLDEARELLSSGRGKAWGAAYADAARSLLYSPEIARAWLGDAERFADLSDPDIRFRVGQTWFDLAATTGAEADYRKSIDILSPLREDPDRRVFAARALATSYDQLGQLPEAERMYRLLLEQDPDQPIMMNNLAYLLVRTQPGSEEAVTLAQTALTRLREQRGSSVIEASFIDTLAGALTSVGKTDDAIITLRDGVRIAPDDPNLIARLALLLSDQRDNPDATREARDLLARFDRLARTRAMPPSATEKTETARARLADQP